MGTPWARGVQELPVEPQRLVLGFGYLRAPSSHRLGAVLTLSKHHLEPLYTSPKALSPLYVNGYLWMDL